MMTRSTLDRKISKLLDEILVIDSLVETATLESIRALKGHDLDLARRIIREDEIINTRRFDLEKDCMITIATQQPIMATDLRLVASILEVVAELERMGDYAKGIATICLRIGAEPHIKPLVDIPKMGDLTVSMLNRAVGAFVERDAQTAAAIPAEDDQVDALYSAVYNELVGIMGRDPAAIGQANLLMWAAHNLERMADRVTNICERTIYIVTGEMKEIGAEDDVEKKAK